MRIRQIGALGLFSKTSFDEIMNQRDSRFAISLAERIVIKSLEDVAFFDMAAKIFKEAMLWRWPHDKIATGNE